MFKNEKAKIILLRATNLPGKAQAPCVRCGGPPAARGWLALGQRRLPGRPVPFLFPPLCSVLSSERIKDVDPPHNPKFSSISRLLQSSFFLKAFIRHLIPGQDSSPPTSLRACFGTGSLTTGFFFAAGGRTRRTTTMAPGFDTIVDPPTWGILVAAL